MNELISIIIPVYNVELYLEKCLLSVMAQTYKNIEIILVDDGATDSSGKICDYYAQIDNRVKVIHKKNGGLSDARNSGLSHSKGNYIMFVDSDDVISHNILEYLWRLIVESSADISICDLVHLFSDKKCVFEQETLRRIFESEDAIIEMLYQKSFLVSVCGKLFRKECFDNILFPYGMLFEDSAIMYKIFDNAKKIVYGNAKLYGYMHREGSITTNNFSIRDCDILTICQQLEEYMSNRNEKLQKAAKSYRTAASFRIYMNAPRSGMFDAKISECRQIIETNRSLLIKDKSVRKKLKIALLMYTFAKPIMPFVYRKINRWK